MDVIQLKSTLEELLKALAATPYAEGKLERSDSSTEEDFQRVIAERGGIQKIENLRHSFGVLVGQVLSELDETLKVDDTSLPTSVTIDPREPDRNNPGKWKYAVEQGLKAKGIHVGAVKGNPGRTRVSITFLFEKRDQTIRQDFGCYVSIAFTTRYAKKSSTSKKGNSRSHPPSEITENARRLRECIDADPHVSDFVTPFRKLTLGETDLSIEDDYGRSIALGYEVSLSTLKQSRPEDLENLIKFLGRVYLAPAVQAHKLIYSNMDETFNEMDAFVMQVNEPKTVDQAVELIRAGYPNLILTGPPGTSKTFSAQEIAKKLSVNSSPVETSSKIDFISLQMHPSYSYEDFIQGWRPVESLKNDSRDNGLAFTVQPGALLEAIENNEETIGLWRSQNPHVAPHDSPSSHATTPLQPVILLLDEINRANIPRVFGEALQLIESSKRCNCLQSERGECPKAIKLAGSDKKIVIPSNFIFIGTMNTSDRSIARLDDALRRRFAFIDLQPSGKVLEHVWREVLRNNDNGNEVARKIGIAFDKLNESLVDPVFVNKKIGHANFMPNPEEEDGGFTQAFLTRRWQYQILPYLESIGGSISANTMIFENLQSWELSAQSQN